MDHIAIMKKSWGLLPKILSGEKKIESRWYKFKRSPWGKVEVGDMIYFKDSGKPVSLRAEAEKVLYFSNLIPKRIRQILDEYGKDDGIDEDKISEFSELFKDKKYCFLIFLKNPEKIEPFKINKKGFGMMSAWMVVGDINKVIKQNVAST